jgi:hypothetical protein
MSAQGLEIVVVQGSFCFSRLWVWKIEVKLKLGVNDEDVPGLSFRKHRSKKFLLTSSRELGGSVGFEIVGAT